MKNPALVILTVITALGMVGVFVVSLLAATRAGQRYDAFTGEFVGAVPMWATLIPLTIAVLAGIAALTVWGVTRRSD